MQGYEDQGYFPTYAGWMNEKAWRHQHTRDPGSEHLPLPSHASFKPPARSRRSSSFGCWTGLLFQMRTMLCVADVLEGALDLDAKSVQDLANQLKNATFGRTSLRASKYCSDDGYSCGAATPRNERALPERSSRRPTCRGSSKATLGCSGRATRFSAQRKTFTKIARKMRDEVMVRNPVDMDDKMTTKRIRRCQAANGPIPGTQVSVPRLIGK